VTGPYGYPAQQPPQPGGYGYGQPYEPRPSGVTAVLAAILGLVLAAMTGYVPIHTFISIPSGYSIGDLPSKVLVLIGVYLVTALLLLIGALATFFRSFAGGILLLIGSLLTIAVISVEPLVALDGKYDVYFKYLFGFEDLGAILGVASLVVSPMLFLLSVIPPTFRYLRYRRPVPQTYRAQTQAYPPRSW
jgi:hypothetical protein